VAGELRHHAEDVGGEGIVISVAGAVTLDALTARLVAAGRERTTELRGGHLVGFLLFVAVGVGPNEAGALVEAHGRAKKDFGRSAVVLCGVVDDGAIPEGTVVKGCRARDLGRIQIEIQRAVELDPLDLKDKGRKPHRFHRLVFATGCCGVADGRIQKGNVHAAFDVNGKVVVGTGAVGIGDAQVDHGDLGAADEKGAAAFNMNGIRAV
jgi:hypothetical protein